MAISRDKKSKIVEKVKQIVDSQTPIVFVNFHGLPVSESTKLRNELRTQTIGYFVAKKTLIKKVLSESKIVGEIPDLTGELGLAFLSNYDNKGVSDLVGPARGVYDFHKKSGLLEIVGGVFEGKYVDKEAMMEIAMIPAREILYGKFVNIINWPIQGLVIALNQVAEKKSA